MKALTLPGMARKGLRPSDLRHFHVQGANQTKVSAEDMFESTAVNLNANEEEPVSSYCDHHYYYYYYYYYYNTHCLIIPLV